MAVAADADAVVMMEMVVALVAAVNKNLLTVLVEKVSLFARGAFLLFNLLTSR